MIVPLLNAARGSGNGVKILPRRRRYVESCTGMQNFNVLPWKLEIALVVVQR